MALFKKRNKTQMADSLARYLPGGELFAAAYKSGTNFRNFLEGLAGRLLNADEFVSEYNTEYYPDQTVKFLEEWESALGIPDDCFDGQGTLAQRRRNVLVKLAASGVQTVNDFIELANTYGFTITVYPLSSRAFPPYDLPFIPVGLPEARFILVFQGEDLVSGLPPYDVPFDLIVGETELQCILRKLVPANVDPIFINSN